MSQAFTGLAGMSIVMDDAAVRSHDPAFSDVGDVHVRPRLLSLHVSAKPAFNVTPNLRSPVSGGVGEAGAGFHSEHREADVLADRKDRRDGDHRQ